MLKTPKRIVVIGSSCAGKTTFASRLAAEVKAKHIELDALHWEPNWKEADDSAFRFRVKSAIDAESWVVDGNYTHKIQDLVWSQADTLIWLDPPLSLILRRFFYRSISRSLKGEMLWGHSRETLRNNIFSRNSLLMWILTTHKRRAKAYQKLILQPPSGITVHRLCNQKQMSEFLSALESSQSI